MQLARVIGTVVVTRKDESLVGIKLLLDSYHSIEVPGQREIPIRVRTVKQITEI